MKRLNFDAMAGVNKIERDERLSIKVTLQYYKVLSPEEINEDLFRMFAATLAKSAGGGKIKKSQKEVTPTVPLSSPPKAPSSPFVAPTFTSSPKKPFEC